jgi:hypothetical protein
MPIFCHFSAVFCQRRCFLRCVFVDFTTLQASVIELHKSSAEALMPRDGEVNREFGIYRSTCCNAEIVIPEGVTFPQCARHVSTEWKDITDVDYIPRAPVIATEKSSAK